VAGEVAVRKRGARVFPQKCLGDKEEKQNDEGVSLAHLA